MKMIKSKFKKKSSGYNYMVLSFYISDIENYLGSGKRSTKFLYFGNEKQHIVEVFKLYNKLSPRPVWINKAQLNKYRTAILFT